MKISYYQETKSNIIMYFNFQMSTMTLMSTIRQIENTYFKNVYKGF